MTKNSLLIKPDDVIISFAEMRNIRKNLGLSQQEMAKQLSITRELVNKMETGRNKVSHRTRFRLQELYGDRLPQLILPPPRDQQVRDPRTDYTYHSLVNRSGWQGVPVYNQPLNAVFTAAFAEGRLPQPDFYLPDPGFADCDFAAQQRGEVHVQEVRNGDYVLCQQIHDLGFLDFGVIYFIVTTNGQEVCKYLYPHSGEDDELYLLHGNLKDVPVTPIKKQYIARIYRVKGVVRSY